MSSPESLNAFDELSCVSLQGNSTLEGWEFVQETMLSHDEDMIADFADDIDTLLVFVSIAVIGWAQLTSTSLTGWPFLRRPHRLPRRLYSAASTRQLSDDRPAPFAHHDPDGTS